MSMEDLYEPWRPPGPDTSLMGLKNMWARECGEAQAKLDEALKDMATWRHKAYELQRTVDAMHRVLDAGHSIYGDD